MAGLGVTLTRGASPEFLEASGINTVDEKTVGEELLKAGENAKNNKQRRHVLEIWKTFAPKSESLRRKFVRRVMIPYARSNKEALRQVVNHLELALPLPRGVRQPFVAALREEGKAAGIRDRVDEKLLEVGCSNALAVLGSASWKARTRKGRLQAREFGVGEVIARRCPRLPVYLPL